MATITKSSIFTPSLLLLLLLLTTPSRAFEYKEATIDGIQSAFKAGELNSTQLVEHYISEINQRNSTLFALIELNPNARSQAQQEDQNRTAGQEGRTKLAGIPILLKDSIGTKYNIATNDTLNTTAGSYALFGSVVANDAFVVSKLRAAGAIILGKASLTQWSGIRSFGVPDGWSSRGGQGINPYNKSLGVCGSSSGPAISTAANLVTVALGAETDGSIICPSAYNSVVGFRPTVNLTSRSGVIPISLRQDTVGPIARTVTDAVRVLDIIVGKDDNDTGTVNASTHIPTNGYAQYLNSSGLSGKRLGVLRNSDNFNITVGSIENATYEAVFQTLRNQSATLVENLVIDISEFFDPELTALLAEFKRDLNAYLAQLQYSPVKTLEDIIAFNKNHTQLEKTEEYRQDLLEEAQLTNGINQTVRDALSKLENLTKNGFEKLMNNNTLDALMFTARNVPFVAVGGFPAITVPAGYDNNNKPLALSFAGLTFQEPKLIQIAFAFEQATKKRVAPPDNLQMFQESEGKELIAQS